MRTVRAAAEHARALGVDRLDAQLLLAHVLQRERTWIIAHDDATLDPLQAESLRELAARRAAGTPLAQLVGGREFRGLWIAVTGDVLVPRPETELLVERALAALQDRGSGARLLDLGTGSGAIALAVKAARADTLVAASDREATALAVARANAARLGLEIEFRAGSWWDPWRDCRFDIVVANPPYIAAQDPHLAALVHEPAAALIGGADGLDALRAIVQDAPRHLEGAGWLLLEHGQDQADAVRTLLLSRGLRAVRTWRDLSGAERATGGRRM